MPAFSIDTRKQRLKGRAAALQNVLLQLLQRHHFIFAGFSGQDLDDNKNYLGLRDAAPLAKGFTYLFLPGSTIRESMNALISFYGENKACSLACDPAQYLERFVQASGISFNSFAAVDQDHLSIRDRLKQKIESIEPMDAINMLASLAESYGDEVSARYLYDKVWRNRFGSDYEGDALSRFLLNHGRSYVFNFEDKEERAISAGVQIAMMPVGQAPEGFEEVFTNPAKRNLGYVNNVSPETVGLIGLVQTYLANPVWFADFPQNLVYRFHSKPDQTEMADIIYYYSTVVF